MVKQEDTCSYINSTGTRNLELPTSGTVIWFYMGIKLYSVGPKGFRFTFNYFGSMILVQCTFFFELLQFFVRNCDYCCNTWLLNTDTSLEPDLECTFPQQPSHRRDSHFSYMILHPRQNWKGWIWLVFLSVIWVVKFLWYTLHCCHSYCCQS